jgi:hypothetical protein
MNALWKWKEKLRNILPFRNIKFSKLWNLNRILMGRYGDSVHRSWGKNIWMIENYVKKLWKSVYFPKYWINLLKKRWRTRLVRLHVYLM